MKNFWLKFDQKFLLISDLFVSFLFNIFSYFSGEKSRLLFFDISNYPHFPQIFRFSVGDL